MRIYVCVCVCAGNDGSAGDWSCHQMAETMVGYWAAAT